MGSGGLATLDDPDASGAGHKGMGRHYERDLWRKGRMKKATGWLLDFGGDRSTDFLACSSLRFFGLVLDRCMCLAAILLTFPAACSISHYFGRVGDDWCRLRVSRPTSFYTGKILLRQLIRKFCELSKGRRVCRIAAGRRCG